MKELSLRPYSGRLYVVKTRMEYEKAHMRLFKEPDILHKDHDGRMAGRAGKDGIWTYLIWGKNVPVLAHEISHVILDVFDRCGIDPRECNGEPFCYMLSQLLLEARSK